MKLTAVPRGGGEGGLSLQLLTATTGRRGRRQDCAPAETLFFFFFFSTAAFLSTQQLHLPKEKLRGGGCCAIHAHKTSNRSATGDHVTSVHFLKCNRAELKAEARINLSRTCLLISSGKTNTAALKTTKVHAELSSNHRGVRESEEA